jgi:hypothetical protein
MIIPCTQSPLNVCWNPETGVPFWAHECLKYLKKTFDHLISSSKLRNCIFCSSIFGTEVGVPFPQINNSKLCRLRQISNKKYKAIKELYLDWKLYVHAIPGFCTLNIFNYEICGKLRKHHCEPLFGHGNTKESSYKYRRHLADFLGMIGDMSSLAWLWVGGPTCGFFGGQLSETAFETF